MLSNLPSRLPMPRPYEYPAVALSVLGLALFAIQPIVAMALSLLAAGVLVVSTGIMHRARTGWTRWAVLLTVVGLVIQVGYLVTAPGSVVAHR
jgi:hypothetical protein